VTSPLHSINSRERVTARSFASDIFPVGQPVVVSIHPTGNFGNVKPAVTLRSFGNSLAMGSAFPFPARRSNRWQRVVRYSRCTLNLFGPFKAARRFIPRIKSFQESARGLSKCFGLPLPVVVHETQHAAKARPDVGYE
jgi:hypothetical protein